MLHHCTVLWGSLEDGVSGCDLSCLSICQKYFNEMTVPARSSLKWVSGLLSLTEREVQSSSVSCYESLPSGKVDHSIFCGWYMCFSGNSSLSRKTWWLCPLDLGKIDSVMLWDITDAYRFQALKLLPTWPFLCQSFQSGLHEFAGLKFHFPSLSEAAAGDSKTTGLERM